MRIPKNLLTIGVMDMMWYTPQRHGRAASRVFGSHILACNRTWTTLFILPDQTSGKKKLKNDQVRTSRKIEVPDGPLKKIGYVLSMQYGSAWWEDSYTRYEHVFDNPAVLYGDKYSRAVVMAIQHHKGKIVTPDGIRG